MFAAFGNYAGRASIGIATSKEEQSFLVEDQHFAIAPYVGKHGWVLVWLDGAPDWELIEDLLRRAHARVLAKRPTPTKRWGAGRKKAKAKPGARVQAKTRSLAQTKARTKARTKAKARKGSPKNATKAPRGRRDR